MSQQAHTFEARSEHHGVIIERRGPVARNWPATHHIKQRVVKRGHKRFRVSRESGADRRGCPSKRPMCDGNQLATSAVKKQHPWPGVLRRTLLCSTYCLKAAAAAQVLRNHRACCPTAPGLTMPARWWQAVPRLLSHGLRQG